MAEGATPIALANDGTLVTGSGSAVGTLKVGANRLGFFGGAAVAKPTVPLTTPAVQDVIDALVSLGLVTQSD